MGESAKPTSGLQPKRGPISMLGERKLTLRQMLGLLLPGGRKRAIARDRAAEGF
jgi:hypothetical protein